MDCRMELSKLRFNRSAHLPGYESFETSFFLAVSEIPKTRPPDRPSRAITPSPINPDPWKGSIGFWPVSGSRGSGVLDGFGLGGGGGVVSCGGGGRVGCVSVTVGVGDMVITGGGGGSVGGVSVIVGVSVGVIVIPTGSALALDGYIVTSTNIPSNKMAPNKKRCVDFINPPHILILDKRHEERVRPCGYIDLCRRISQEGERI